MADWLMEIPRSEAEGEFAALSIYLFLAFSAFAENVFPPWPGDTTTVVGGFLAAQGAASFSLSLLAVLLGNLAGAVVIYISGERIIHLFAELERRIRGPRFLKSALAQLVSPEQMQRVQGWFQKWGLLFVLVSRFSAGVRFFVSIVAGICRMNLALFLSVFSASVLLWNSLLLWGGYKLGENWSLIVEWLRIYNAIVIILILAALLLWIFRRPLRLFIKRLANSNPKLDKEAANSNPNLDKQEPARQPERRHSSIP